MPVSSSPENAITKSLPGTQPSDLSLKKAAITAVIPNLSSPVPRPKKYPSSSIKVKGSLVQSDLNASTTSIWAEMLIGFFFNDPSPLYVTIKAAVSSIGKT